MGWDTDSPEKIINDIISHFKTTYKECHHDWYVGEFPWQLNCVECGATQINKETYVPGKNCVF